MNNPIASAILRTHARIASGQPQATRATRTVVSKERDAHERFGAEPAWDMALMKAAARYGRAAREQASEGH